MGVHGTTGASCAGSPPLPARTQAVLLQAAAGGAGCCHEPTELTTRAVRHEQLHASGLAAAVRARSCEGHHPPARAAAAANRPAVIGGGAVAADPALALLASMLGESAAAPRTQPSLLARLTGQVAMLLSMAGGRIAALLPGGGEPAAALPARADVPMPAPQPMPLQPPAPPPVPLGPVLTLDPALGTIVDPERGADPARGTGDTTSGAEGADGDELVLPSAWVPITGALSGRALRRRLGSLLDRIEGLLAETGVTRLQLLLLLVLAPMATAFLIDVVVSMLGGR